MGLGFLTAELLWVIICSYCKYINIISVNLDHLRLIESELRIDRIFYSFSFLGNMFQKRKVSSPAPVTIVVPSGFIAKYKTLYVWPVNVSIFYIFGIFHMFISFRE